MAKVVFDLSEGSVAAAIKEIKRIERLLRTSVNQEFMKLSLEWIRDRAIKTLEMSGQDNTIVRAIANSFEIAPTTAKTLAWKLTNSLDKAVYIEFGVGIVGQGSHPLAGETGYDYNVPSDSKNADGTWTFTRRLSAGIDIKEENRESTSTKGGGEALVITTRGQGGELYMYNACMDYANSTHPQRLYQIAYNKYIK